METTPKLFGDGGPEGQDGYRESLLKPLEEWAHLFVISYCQGLHACRPYIYTINTYRN